MLKRKKLELRASKPSASGSKDTKVERNEPSYEDSSSDDEVENFKVDWRAKHI